MAATIDSDEQHKRLRYRAATVEPIGLQGTLAQVLDAEAIHMIRTFETADHKGAAAAFVEKRAPSFNGR
jgi:hypothetical protein